MSDITYRLVKGTELTFGELDRNFGSLDSDIISLQSQVDSLAVAAGLDSARAINLITSTVDSAYVELMYSKIDIFRDSFFVENIVDSPYVNARVDLALLGAPDSDTIISLIDSALDSVGPFYDTPDHDSDTLVQVDSAYVRFRADSDYIKTVVDSDYIKFIADSDYVKSAADSAYVTRIAEEVAGLDSAKLVRFLDSEARHIIPLDGETYDLGTNLKRWRNIYVKDLFVSPATIHFSDSAETPQSTLSLDSNGEFRITSPSGTGFIATSSTGAALDSSAILGIVDSAYVQAREASGGAGGLDSASTIALIDSAYIQARQVDIDTVRDSAFIFGLIDSAYIQLRQVDLDTVRDSAFVSGIIDSTYVQARVTFPADQVGIDSATSISLTQSTVDSAYVQARVTFPTDEVGIDSAQAIALVDSAYVQARVTFPADQVGLDSTQTINLIDSAYVQARQVDLDTVRDSAFINGLIDTRIDSTQFLATTATTTDVAEGDNLYYTTARHDSDTLAQVDSAYVQQRVRGPEMIAGGRIKMSSGGIWVQNGTFQKQLFGIWDSGQGPGGTNGITRNTGLYKFQFDSANLARITSGDDYTVMVTADYGADDPIASSRTVNVMVQADSSFQIVWERSDTGDQENYSDTAHINFQVWLY